VNVAVVPDTVTVPATAAPPPGVSVKVVVVTDAALMGSENDAVTVVFRATPVAEGVGVTLVTVGAVRSKSTPPSSPHEMRNGTTAAIAPRRREWKLIEM
jgi:hypothetical protein